MSVHTTTKQLDLTESPEPSANWNTQPSASKPSISELPISEYSIPYKHWTWRRLGELGGHIAEIDNAVFTQNGERIVLAGRALSIQFWNVLEGIKIHEPDEYPYEEQRNRLSSSISADCRHLLTVSNTGLVRVFDLALGYLIDTRQLKLPRGFLLDYAVFSRNGRFLALTVDFDKIEVWNMDTLKLVLETKGFRALAISPDGKQIALQDRIGVGIYERARREPIRILESLTAHREWPLNKATEMEFSPSGRLVAFSHNKSRAQLRHTRIENVMDDLDPRARFPIAFSPDEKYILTAFSEGGIKLWDLRALNKILVSILDLECNVFLIAFSSDGKRVATVKGPRVTIWDAADEIEPYEKATRKKLMRHGDALRLPLGKSDRLSLPLRKDTLHY